jgi:hypothetical protein
VRVTLIDEREVSVDATVDGDMLRVSREDLKQATGWELKPEGLCKGPVCVPWKSDDPDAIDVRSVAGALGRAFVLDEAGGVAAIAGDPMSSGQRASIDELELPDVRTGETVRMSDFAGRKRLLIAWASW